MISGDALTTTTDRVELLVELTRKELRRVARVVIWKGPGLAVNVALIVGLTAALVSFLDTRTVSAGLAVVGLYAYLLLFTRATGKVNTLATAVTVTPTAIAIARDGVTITYAWSAIIGFVEQDWALILRTTPLNAVALPKRCFAGEHEVDAVRAMAADAGFSTGTAAAP